MLTKILYTFLLLSACIGIAKSQAPPIQWQYCYGNLGQEQVLGAQQTSDGGYVLCGLSGTTYADENCWIVKLDQLGTVVWQKVIGGSGKERAVCIKQTTDGGYIVGGYSNSTDGAFSSNHGANDYWVAKLNSTGDIVWQKLLGGIGDQVLRSIQQTTDGGYIICGYTNGGGGDVSSPIGSDDCWIVKLDSLGAISWQRCYGSGNYDQGFGIKQTPDGGYIAVGKFNAMNSGFLGCKAWVLKLSSNGNIEWQKTYGTIEGGDIAADVCILSDGTYGIGAISAYYNDGDVTDNHGTVDYWVLKLDLAGNILWQRSLGGCCSDNLTCINATPDGGMVSVGFIGSGNSGNITGSRGPIDIWVVKLSSAGDLEWQKVLGGNSGDLGFYVAQTTDMGYIVAGYSTSNNSGDVGNNPNGNNPNVPFFYAGWVIKLGQDPVPVTLVNFDANAKGEDVLCTWQTSREQNSHHFEIERSDDAIHFNEAGTVTAAGNSSLPINYQFTDKNILLTGKEYLYYRLKMVDIDGSFKYSNVVKVTLKYASSFSVYPNPATDHLTINFISTTKETDVIVIYNDAGSKLYEQTLSIVKGNNHFQIDIHSFPAGTYTVMLKSKKKYFQRIIKTVT